MSGSISNRPAGLSDPIVWAILTAAAAVRLAVVLTCGTLGEDRDAYISLADGLVNRGQYGVFGPTAFRPPLYPILIAPFELFAPSAAGLLRGVLNVVCGVSTVALAADLGASSGGRDAGRIASGLAACSPLAVLYCGYSMTEIVCGCLLTTAVWLAMRCQRSERLRDAVLLGLTLGLGALCRPTVWPAAFLVLLVLAADRRWRIVAVVAAAMVVTVSPWPIRNAVAMGSPTVLTTHGGYTLALGNNDRFYDDVVHSDWGTVWTDGQSEWIDDELAVAATRGVTGEYGLDAFHKTRAIEVVRRRPRDFAAACWLRLRRFWSPVPVSASVGPALGIALWTYGFTVIALVAVGSFRSTATWQTKLLLWAAPAAFCVVHLFYWSNARMRLPIEPCLFVLAGLAATRRSGQRPEVTGR